MLSHSQIWRAIDALAARHGMSPSGLAKQAGLDPTTFNKSKRGGDGGKLRWPSTESLSKVLAATGSSLEELVVLITEGAPKTRMVPLIGLARRAPAAISTMPVFRQARAGNRSPFRKSPIPIATHSRSPAIPCCRSIAMATAFWFRRPALSGAATGSWSRPWREK